MSPEPPSTADDVDTIAASLAVPNTAETNSFKSRRKLRRRRDRKQYKSEEDKHRENMEKTEKYRLKMRGMK